MYGIGQTKLYTVPHASTLSTLLAKFSIQTVSKWFQRPITASPTVALKAKRFHASSSTSRPPPRHRRALVARPGVSKSSRWQMLGLLREFDNENLLEVHDLDLVLGDGRSDGLDQKVRAWWQKRVPTQRYGLYRCM